MTETGQLLMDWTENEWQANKKVSKQVTKKNQIKSNPIWVKIVSFHRQNETKLLCHQNIETLTNELIELSRNRNRISLFFLLTK